MKRTNSIYLSVVVCLLFITSCGLNRSLKKADKKYEIGEYASAAVIYKRLLPNISSANRPLRAEVCYKMGNCYRLTNQNLRAEGAYGKAIRYDVQDSLAYIYYGEVLRKLKKYTEAAAFYRKYLNYDDANTWAVNGLKSSENVKNWEKVESPFIVKIETALNSRKSEFSPAFGDDQGSSVYFTSSRENQSTGNKLSKITGLRNNDIFIAKKNNSGKWEDPTALDEIINSEYDEGSCCFSSDGKTMYFTQCRSVIGVTLGAEIYVTQRAGGEWTSPKKISLINDSSRSVAHPAISPDNKYLYFVSDMRGGFGGKDLWRCLRINDSEWELPENLGPDINTPGDEMFPTIKVDGTLYFSSNGLPGYGGLDIFKATLNNDISKKDSLSWTVKNMLMPINSSNDDFGMTFMGNNDKGFFSSNRNEPKGYDKLYSFEVPVIEYTVEGKVFDTKNEPISDAIVRIVGDNGVNTKIRVKKDGSYLYKVEKDVNYIMQASARGYINDKNNISIKELKNKKLTGKNFTLAAVGKPVNIANIFYEFGKYTLNPKSEEALLGLVKMLNDNPHITIEIGAHTDMVGSEESNLLLSTKRAEAVVEFLVKSGIEKERLVAKGYGESKPVVVDAVIAQQNDFLKEGDVLDVEFIEKLIDKQKDIANTINRRTEFIVLKTTYKMY